MMQFPILMVRLAVVIATVAIPFGCSDDPTLGAPPDEQVQQNLPDPSEAIQKRIEGKTREALVILRKLNEEHPDSPEILTLLGRTLLDAEEYALAAFRLEQAFSLGGATNILSEAGQAHELAEDDESAEKAYATYIKKQSISNDLSNDIDYIINYLKVSAIRLYIELQEQYGQFSETTLFSIQEIAEKEKPKMIVAGASAYSRDMDFERFREIADSVGALLLADISHPAGLIAKGLLNDPIPHCHIVTTTTHKTLRGPRGGLILMGEDFDNPFGIKLKNGNLRKMSALLDLAVFPGNQGGPLEHIIAAKAVAFGEALTDNFLHYVIQVKKNAEAMAKAFVAKGYNIISGGTDNHMMLIDLRNKDITGKDAEKVLVEADITANKNMVPFDDKSPFITSGIRFGTAAITTRGLKEDDMSTIVDLVDEVLTNAENETKVKEVKQKVNALMKGRELFNF